MKTARDAMYPALWKALSPFYDALVETRRNFMNDTVGVPELEAHKVVAALAYNKMLDKCAEYYVENEWPGIMERVEIAGRCDNLNKPNIESPSDIIKLRQEIVRLRGLLSGATSILEHQYPLTAKSYIEEMEKGPLT